MHVNLLMPKKYDAYFKLQTITKELYVKNDIKRERGLLLPTLR